MADKGWISKWAFQNDSLKADSIGRTAMEDGFTTIAKVEAALLDEVLGPFLMSFETNEYPCTTKIYVSHKTTVNKVRTIVTKLVEATDDATITLSNATGAMANGAVTITKNAAINTEDSATPTTNNVIAADSYIQLVSAKTTAGGKVLVTLECTRTA